MRRRCSYKRYQDPLERVAGNENGLDGKYDEQQSISTVSVTRQVINRLVSDVPHPIPVNFFLPGKPVDVFNDVNPAKPTRVKTMRVKMRAQHLVVNFTFSSCSHCTICIFVQHDDGE